MFLNCNFLVMGNITDTIQVTIFSWVHELSHLQIDGALPHPLWGWSCGKGKHRPQQGHWGKPKPVTPRARETGTSTSLQVEKTWNNSLNWHTKTSMVKEGSNALRQWIEQNGHNLSKHLTCIEICCGAKFRTFLTYFCDVKKHEHKRLKQEHTLGTGHDFQIF